jgi:hypothetical protein
MNPLRRSHLPSLAVKSLGLVAVLVLVWCAGNIPAHASECYFAENIITTYYSSAAHTQIVGRCSQGPCLGAGCTGTKSSYVTVSNSSICEVCVE